MANPPLIVMVGPTAVGKTEAAIFLAQRLDGEIISADSRQVYRLMDIGTAKPTSLQKAQAPHHLIDILDPDQELNVAQFQALAYQAIRDVIARGKLPLLVGGTGQYLRAVIEGWTIPEVAPDYRIRLDFELFADVYGSTTLHAELVRVDPVAASALDHRNVRRVVRALEVSKIAGQPISALQERRPLQYRVLTIGVTRSREELYRRADRRIDQMIQDGLVDEVRQLMESSFGPELPSMSSLGYPEMFAHLTRAVPLEDAVMAMKRATRRFIRHQMNWFRADDPSIEWFDLDRLPHQQILEFVLQWLQYG